MNPLKALIALLKATAEALTLKIEVCCIFSCCAMAVTCGNWAAPSLVCNSLSRYR